MKHNEATTNLWVHTLLLEAGITLDPQGSSIVEINNALKSASKRGTGRVGFPEYVGIVGDFLLVIEDKCDLSRHVKYNDKNLICMQNNSITNYAINGALFYAKHLVANTEYKKAIAFGISGNEKHHRISPIFVDETEYYLELPDVESFISFNEQNINEYYTKEILKETTDIEKETSEILKDAATLHEDLRNYGNLLDTEKPLIVSGILLALREIEFKNFSIDDLTGDTIKTDGQIIFDAIQSNLRRANVSPDVKRDKILGQFSFIKDTVKLNEKDEKLNKTPLRYFCEFLYRTIYRSIRYSRSAEDFIGRFYGEFMSYSGGDGQTLGIILTPKHITELFCDLIDLKATDTVFDPCCGTGGFLIAAMQKMLAQTTNSEQQKNIRQNQLHGIELRPNMFAIATTNMILRGDGKSNLFNDDFLKQDPNKLQLTPSTVGMMNPPYSQGSKQNPEMYEIAFTEHLLNSLSTDARCIVIVPQSCMTGKTKEEQTYKESILRHHTLEGVITLNKDTFYGVGTMPCIAIFKVGTPHPASKICKFINFEDDGYKVSPHIGLVETESAKDKKQHLLDVWFDRIDSESRFCVKTPIQSSDEWLHSFYYFNDEIPSDQDFDKTIGDYLSFEFSMIMQGRCELVQRAYPHIPSTKSLSLHDRDWKPFRFDQLFQVKRGESLYKQYMESGTIPYVSASATNNGISAYTKNANRDGNMLSLAYDGSVGATFYHESPWFASEKIVSIELLERSFNRELALFFARVIEHQKNKYNYGYKWSVGIRMMRGKIMVPVDANGNPDYEFMEHYISQRETHKQAEYFRHCQIN